MNPRNERDLDRLARENQELRELLLSIRRSLATARKPLEETNA